MIFLLGGGSVIYCIYLMRLNSSRRRRIEAEEEELETRGRK